VKFELSTVQLYNVLFIADSARIFPYFSNRVIYDIVYVADDDQPSIRGRTHGRGTPAVPSATGRGAPAKHAHGPGTATPAGIPGPGSVRDSW